MAPLKDVAGAAMTDPPRKLFWKRKRWIAAVVVWLVVVYPLSVWPVAYAVGRGWLPITFVQAFYAPVLYGADALRPHPGIGLAPPDAEGRRAYIVLPDPSPWPRPIAQSAQAYLEAAEWFASLGKQHAAR
jgi:hypothetical protein